MNNEIDIHVYNDSDQFQLNRINDSTNWLVVEKTVYDIENYKTMKIVIKEFDDSINIRLLNVVLMLEFFINLICLIKVMKKEIYWNIENKKLHRKKIIFCFVKFVESSWVLEKNASIDERFEAFETKSDTFKSNLMITSRK